MKVEKAVDAVRSVVRRPGRSLILNVLKATAGTASAIWLAMRVRKELYGPGGTRLTRHPRRKDRDD